MGDRLAAPALSSPDPASSPRRLPLHSTALSAGFPGASLAARQALATDDTRGFRPPWHLPGSLVSRLRRGAVAWGLNPAGRAPAPGVTRCGPEAPPGLHPLPAHGQGVSPARSTVTPVCGSETETRLLSGSHAVAPGTGSARGCRHSVVLWRLVDVHGLGHQHVA